MNKSIVLTFTATAIALTLSACGKDADKKAATAPEKVAVKEAVRPVRTITVAPAAVGDILYLPAEVKPRYEQRYGFRVSGKLAKRLVDVGQSVVPGQVLAVMDSADIAPAIAAQQAQVEANRTDLALQQAELKRVQELAAKNFVSAAALDRQKASTDAANARLKAAQSQLSSVQNGLTFQTLRADKPGVVIAVDAEAGTVVAAGQSIVRVAQTGEKEWQVSVPERSLKALREASAANAANAITGHADAVPGKIYVAKLRELAPTADAASRTYAARLSIVNADEALRWGMSGTLRVGMQTSAQIVVPNTALYTRDSQVRVWVVDKATTTVKAASVTLGASNDGGVVITSGLKAGDIVVTAGANLLQNGQVVRLLAPEIADKAVTATTGGAK